VGLDLPRIGDDLQALSVISAGIAAELGNYR
jgi:hypothetical protein